jgi:hypothetical protein
MKLEIPMCSYQRLEGYKVPVGFRGRSAVYVQLWWLTQSTLFAPSPQPMYAWRNLLLRFFGAQVGRHTIIGQSATDVFAGPGVRMRRGAVVGVRSIVLGEVPAGSINVGTSALVVGKRTMRCS